MEVSEHAEIARLALGTLQATLHSSGGPPAAITLKFVLKIPLVRERLSPL
jgi:hypothetical protein